MVVRPWTNSRVGAALAKGMRRLNTRHPWSHNDHFHGWIVANLPRPCTSALDVGCGQGELLARLAPHVRRVVGSDLDPTMRTDAARRCADLPNVSVVDGPWTEVDGRFDVVTMVAVLHHLDAADALREVRRLLAPGGRFLAVGLAPPVSVRDHVWDLASAVTNPVIGYVKHPRPHRDGVAPPPFPVRDPRLSFDELRVVLELVMPGAVIRRRLAFRHTIAWTKA